MQHLMQRVDSAKVLSILKGCLSSDRELVELHEPCFLGNEWNYAKECLNSGWVSSIGKFVGQFERKLIEFTGAKEAVAVVNGTAALHASLQLLGVGPGDEVLVPDLMFIAAANAVVYCGGIPHFVDSEEETLGIDPEKLNLWLTDISQKRGEDCFNRYTGRRIKAVIAVHTFGHPVNLDRLVEVCKRFGLNLIEDAAESLGSFYKGRHTGNWGEVAILSFNGNKVVTTGGGGAILTNNPRIGRIAKHLTTTARISHPWLIGHDQVGYNYRLPNINAAIGCAQLEQLPFFLTKKRALAERYRNAFDGLRGLRFFVEPEFAQSNYWLNVLLLDEGQAVERDTLLALTNSAGVMTRPVWSLMHKQPMFKKCPMMDVSAAESLEARIVNIPSSAIL